MFRPKALPQAIGLALLQEGTMKAILKEVKGPNRNNTNPAGFSEARKGNNNQLPPIKRISAAEMQERRDKKLCYYCDEKYEPGHKCKKRQIFLLEGEESEDTIDENSTETKDPIVSVHALSGSVSHQTMRIRGNIKNKAITILIDSGSTHNFLDPVVAKRTGCTIQSTSPMRVTVADGTKITSDSICKHLKWNMQGKEFQADLRLISLGGCDMVSGIQWLAKHGPILWDFRNLKMEFTVDGRNLFLELLPPL